jgi:hypothetical protein
MSMVSSSPSSPVLRACHWVALGEQLEDARHHAGLGGGDDRKAHGFRGSGVGAIAVI